MPDGVMLSKEYERQIRDLIRRDRGAHRTLNELEGKQSSKKPSRFPPRAVILDAALVAPSTAVTPTKALATVLRWSTADEAYVETSQQIYVFNHAETKSHAIDTFGAAIHINGHYWFFGDCEAMASRP